jgi:hypothetical protein
MTTFDESFNKAMVAATVADKPVAAPKISPTSLELFLAFARDAGNWSGTPMVGGNVRSSKELRGNLTQLKRAKLLTTFDSDGERFVSFTEAGIALAAQHGVDIS